MGRLEVRICGARNIGDAQKVGIPDPYVKILMGDRKKSQIKYKTKVVSNNLNPIWDETAKFQIADYDSAQIIFEVWNDNVMVDDLMGSYSLSVNGLTRGVVTDMWAILTGTRLSSAEIHLQILAVDFGADPSPGCRVVHSIEEFLADPDGSASANAGKKPNNAFGSPPSPVAGVPLQPQQWAPPPPQPTYGQQSPYTPAPLQPQFYPSAPAPQYGYPQGPPPPMVYGQAPPSAPPPQAYYPPPPQPMYAAPPAPQGGYYPAPQQPQYAYGPPPM